MNESQKKLILATVPVLKAQGLALTKYFYERMFRHNPEMKNIFNMGNQQSGKQQTALAMAVLAYAENIANPGVLMPVIDRIGHKHVSINIRPEQYQIVGTHLLASILEVLGEIATAEITEAWAVAYAQLAAIMSGHEANLYQQQISIEGSWTGWRPFRLEKKEAESKEVSSFYLYPIDGGKTPIFQSGQFVSIKLYFPELKLNQIRQYSLSDAPGKDYLRISVKREFNAPNSVKGMISNYLHDHLHAGSIVELSAPSGNFILPQRVDAPITFISGGVGITPLMSMMEHLAKSGHDHKINWIHACRNREVHAFADRKAILERSGLNITEHIFYDHCSQEDKNAGVNEGYLNLFKIKDFEVDPNGLYYLCGPSAFIRKQFEDLRSLGIKANQIYFEEFGPQLLNIE
ncbi:NO-inducible flavohemoprotein [Pedobacter sp.]|uniref:NO-inducible flavohemoprotein n=1 Tax=Pedobacter sp. TaxID=1411316 RepID=UPI003C461634